VYPFRKVGCGKLLRNGLNSAKGLNHDGVVKGQAVVDVVGRIESLDSASLYWLF
jgi:hypothetical protein